MGPGLRVTRAASLAVMALGLSLSSPLAAVQPAARIPVSDDEVLYRSDREWIQKDDSSVRALRERWRQDPEAVRWAVPLAERYLDMARRTGDTRYTGHARAVLRPWWGRAEVPRPVAVLRARVRARAHEFNAAAGELEALVSRGQGDGRVLLELAMIHLAKGDVAAAASACRDYRRFERGLMGVTCSAMVEGRSGNARRSFSRIARALARSADSRDAVRSFALGELADLAWRLGESPRACAIYEQALSLSAGDHALLMRLADCLQASGRFQRVMTLLEGYRDRDALALRHAIAARSLGLPFDAADIAGRLALARARGAPQPGLEARHALDLGNAPHEALAPALAHFDLERNPDSALLVIRAARAARKATPQRVHDWVRDTRLEDARVNSMEASINEVVW